MNKISINSPAKINLGLNVIEKRTDGFHNIETVFFPVNLHDIIIFEKSESFSFECNIESLKNDDENIIIKALKKLEESTGEKFDVDISLKKNIPLGSGMGGGSSNAASVLLALNELYKLDLEKNYLHKVAAELGSDVPFFLESKPKFASGRGELLEDINFEITYPLLIVNPGIQISTKWAYANVVPKNPQKKLKEIIIDINNFNLFKGLITNDFEDPVFDRYPEIGEIKSELYYLGASFALMTGSGSTLFGIFPNLDTALNAENILNKKYFTYLHYEKK